MTKLVGAKDLLKENEIVRAFSIMFCKIVLRKQFSKNDLKNLIMKNIFFSLLLIKGTVRLYTKFFFYSIFHIFNCSLKY